MATHQSTSKGYSKKVKVQVSGTRSSVKKNHKTSQKQARDDFFELTDDEAVILSESAHIPDRDQLFGSDHQTLPPNIDAIYDDSWVDNPDKQINDDRSTGKDLYNALRDLDHTDISRPMGPVGSAGDPLKVSNRTGGTDVLDFASQDELVTLADAMSIPNRENMNRDELIEALRSVGRTH